MDSRIHFSLNCGARGCPAISVFTKEAFWEELALVTQAFCDDEANVYIEESKNTVWLSKIFNWYSGDFPQQAQLLYTIAGYLRDQAKVGQLQAMAASANFKIKFLEYDWSNDAK